MGVQAEKIMEVGRRGEAEKPSSHIVNNVVLFGWVVENDDENLQEGENRRRASENRREAVKSRHELGHFNIAVGLES